MLSVLSITGLILFYLLPGLWEGFFLMDYYTQRDRGIWAIYYTSPQSFIIRFITTLGTSIIICPYSPISPGIIVQKEIVNFDWLVIQLECSHDQQLILMNRMRNFVYLHWGCTSIYRPLSYPFRSLPHTTFDRH